MSQTASIWLVILAALVAANLPFANQRWGVVGPLAHGRKPLWARLAEMVVLYLLVGGLALLLERRAGQIVPGLRHAQRRLRARKRAVLKKIEIQQRSVAVGGGQQPLRGVGGDEKRFRQGERPLS